MIPQPDEDGPEQEKRRVRQALVREAELLCDGLRRCVKPGSDEAAWLRALASRMAHEGISEDERHFLRRLAWFHRRRLPAHLAPRLNPADPVVMAAEREGIEVHG